MNKTTKDLLAKIANDRLGVTTLDVRNVDALDFHTVGVTGLLNALNDAYEAGQRAGKALGRHAFTAAAYCRVHGKVPSNSRGVWAFKKSAAVNALDSDLSGELILSPMAMNLAEAKKWIAETRAPGLYAVLP